jgi:hypothetical protein
VHIIKTGDIWAATALMANRKQCLWEAGRIVKEADQPIWDEYHTLVCKNSLGEDSFALSLQPREVAPTATPFRNYVEYIKLCGAGKKVTTFPCEQQPYLTNDRAEVIVHFAGYFEQLETVLNTVCQAIVIFATVKRTQGVVHG